MPKDKETNFYFIEISDVENSVLARELADIVASQGGAGYVNMRDKIDVVVAVYKSHDDAKLIYQNLSDGKYSLTKISIDDQNLNFKKNNKRIESAVENTKSVFYDIFQSLYILSNQLANGDISTDSVQVERGRLVDAVQNTIGVFDKDYDQCNGATEKSILSNLRFFCSSVLALTHGVGLSHSNVQLLSEIRYAMVQSTFLYSDLIASIHELL